MDVETIRPGAVALDGAHPDWTEKDGGPGAGTDVASFYYEAPGHVVLLDPQVPPDGAPSGTPDAEHFWRALIRTCSACSSGGRPAHAGLARAQRQRRLRALPHPPGGQRLGAPGQPEGGGGDRHGHVRTG